MTANAGPGGVIAKLLTVGLIVALTACGNSSPELDAARGASSPSEGAAPVTLMGPPAPEVPVRAVNVIEGEIRKGDTLSTAMRRHEIDWLVIHNIDNGMLPVFSFRNARQGDRFVLTLDDETQKIVRFEYNRSRLERYLLSESVEAPDAEEGLGAEPTLVAERLEPDIETRRARIAGVVNGSLYKAISDLGESTGLASAFADIFAWDVDFSRGVQPGDEFSILYERRFLQTEDGSEVYIGPGRVLAGRYTNAGQEHKAYYFEAEEGEGGYYREDGTSVERQFLRAPLKYRRISSRYTTSRLHPILKIRRPHLGIDYAAPRGTPVWSVASGTVVFRGVQGGFGKLIKVRHANGYLTYYGHLSRFVAGVSVGSKVDQKQVVGYVGSTGLSTGPHLDFRMKQNGKYMNPAELDTPPAQPIPSAMMASFKATRDAMLQELEPLPVVASATPGR